jgi:anthranilate phosphoribosyltransferase
MEQTAHSWPSYMIYKDQAVVLETIHAAGSVSCQSMAAQGFTAAGRHILDGLDPANFQRQPISDEAERLRRPSPLWIVRSLQSRAQKEGLHLFAALTYEAAHIFDDLSLPTEPFCQFLIASVTILPTPTWEQRISTILGQTHRPAFTLLDDTSPAFSDHFKQAREHLRMGDVFEIVLSRRFVLDNPNGTAYPYLARAVASLQAPYRFALNFPGTSLVGASPELLVHVDGKKVTNRPISGSMRRLASSAELTQQESVELKKLYESEKEKSELDMLIDLARHDLHRVCNSVEVSHYREALILESVVHTQATVTGMLKPEFDPLDACFSCLNAGTLVGAPKKMAMEIIKSLEGDPRRFYGGNLIHCSPDGGLKSTILIRTFQVNTSQVTLQAGATVLFDSSESYEYWECGAKAQKLLDLVGLKEKAWGDGAPPPIDNRASPEMKAHQVLSSFAEAGSKHREIGRPLRGLLIDNHDSFTFNLAALFGHLGCSITVVRNDAPLPPRSSYDILILSPGPSAPRDAGSLIEICRAHDGNTPIFGVCLGFQALVEARGGELGVMDLPLHGKARLITRCAVPEASLLQGLPEPFAAARYHSLFGKVMPKSFSVFCTDNDGRPMGLADLSENNAPICAVQFHPESFLSGTHGIVLAANWLEMASAWCQNSSRHNRSQAESQAQRLVHAILQDEPNAHFLETSLSHLNGTILAAVVRQLRQTATSPDGLGVVLESVRRSGHVFEVCGTGGTKSHRLNTSTLTALFSAGVGLRTVKHGGRSASGHKGSLDLLEHLGLNLKHLFETSPEALRTGGVTFLGAALTYAPFGRYALARKALARPSIFNLLGPLLSPARPSLRLLGCYGPEVYLLLVDTLCELGEDGVVLYSLDEEGLLDEVNPFGTTELASVSQGKVTFSRLPPIRFDETCLGRYMRDHSDLGESAIKRTELFKDGLAAAQELLTDESLSARAAMAQDFVLANLALMVALDRGQTISAEVTRQIFAQLSSIGHSLRQYSRRTIERLKETKIEDPRSPLYGSHPSWTSESTPQAHEGPNTSVRVHEPQLQLNPKACALLSDRLLIAEVKARTPLLEFQSTLPLSDRVAAYSESASAISVVTHPLFNGSKDLLKSIRSLTELPIVAKDFVKTTDEIDGLIEAGADGVLLLGDWLSRSQIETLAQHCLQKGVLPVIESTVRDPASASPGTPLFLPLLNARNLFSLLVGPRYRQSLAAQSPGSVWASDISTALDARLALAQNKGALVGEALMRLNSRSEVVAFLKNCRAQDPVIKSCGALTAEDCRQAVQAGADMVGVNLLPHSRRYVRTADLLKILTALQNDPALARICLLTGDRTDPSIIDGLKSLGGTVCSQLSEQPYAIPLLPLAAPKAEGERVRMLQPIAAGSAQKATNRRTIGARLLVIDGSVPGSGLCADYHQCPAELRHVPTLVAGGVTPENAKLRMQKGRELGWNVIGVDAATGVSRPGGVGLDPDRINSLRAQL